MELNKPYCYNVTLQGCLYSAYFTVILLFAANLEFGLIKRIVYCCSVMMCFE